ncbi:hypothetical protein NU08_3009 [Flavobacterium anhuiense]|uniref:Uncharacterized protein n=1 Tax=Flavobacterium anhuiense TaxID=459526 RepID=A0A444VX38_9FLAO|nr:hypothetical protein NU08_3009 [Flavobacterium anhuiense]
MDKFYESNKIMLFFMKKKLILYFKKLSLRSEKRGIFDKPK